MKIKVLKDGPLEVSGNVPLKQSIIDTDEKGRSIGWKEGREYSKEEPYHLCRCGHSKNKPFCDGTHVEINFNGQETATKEPYLENVVVYEGETLDLLDNESLCAVARHCDPFGGVWDLAINSGTTENAEMAIKEACDCPSGRMTIRKKDGSLIEPQLEKEIGLVEDVAKDLQGPLWVKGGIEIEDASGETYEVRNRVTLCRCGESQNKPYCDARHLNCKHMKGLDQ